MRFAHCGVAVFSLLITAPELVAQTRTSGRVIDANTGQPVSNATAGVIRKSSVDAAPDGVPLEPELSVPIGRGAYFFEIDGTDPSFHEFYVFTLSPNHFNETFDDIKTSWARPLKSDFASAVVFDGSVDNSGVDFELDSNLVRRKVTMRDGVTRLSTHVSLASPTQPAPTILERTPYGQASAWERAYSLYGYNVAVQDVRGRFDSGGLDEPWRHEGWGQNQDGYDTIEWIASRGWSDGNVGMIGGSAPAINQFLAAGAYPPSLKCCYAIVGAGDLYNVIFTGGIFRKKMMEDWLVLQENEPYLSEWEAHPNKDRWWDEVDISSRVPGIQVPFMHLNGWWDIMQEEAVHWFHELQHNGNTGARGQQRMVMGPWSHWSLFSGSVGQLVYPDAGWTREEILQHELGFFDYWLKGADNGFYDAPAVRYYLMGDTTDPDAPGNEWREAADWPPPSRSTRFYLRADGTLERERGLRQPPGPVDGGFDRVQWTFDPDDPAPTLGGSNLWLAQGPADQRAMEARDDVVTFTSPVLEEPLEITGNLRAHLFISSTALDTDFMVKVTDVYPDGRSMLVQDGAIRARHRVSNRRERLLTPGEVYELEIDLWSTALVFNAGHRLRVSVTSSSDPRWDVNPNTGEPFRQNNGTVVATNTIYCAGGRSSYIVLPVIE